MAQRAGLGNTTQRCRIDEQSSDIEAGTWTGTTMGFSPRWYLSWATAFGCVGSGLPPDHKSGVCSPHLQANSPPVPQSAGGELLFAAWAGESNSSAINTSPWVTVRLILYNGNILTIESTGCTTISRIAAHLFILLLGFSLRNRYLVWLNKGLDQGSIGYGQIQLLKTGLLPWWCFLKLFLNLRTWRIIVQSASSHHTDTLSLARRPCSKGVIL